jgi:hypothetical protein
VAGSGARAVCCTVPKDVPCGLVRRARGGWVASLVGRPIRLVVLDRDQATHKGEGGPRVRQIMPASLLHLKATSLATARVALPCRVAALTV